MFKRHYHFENVLGVNQYDLRNLRALRSKLDRDYLGFFEDLSGLYQKSTQKKELQNTIIKIKQTIGLLNSILEGEAIGKKDVDKLISQINDINADKDYFLQKIPEVKAFSDRVNKVTKETGISPKDLNITEGIVKDVAKGTQKAQKEKTGSFLRRTMPGTLGLAGGLAKGLGTALAGPFAPILGPIVGDVFRAGKAISQKVSERREVGLGEQLRPVGAGISPSRAETISGARRESPFVGGFAGKSYRGREAVAGRGKKLSSEDMVRPLTYFFDKKAYRSKWTKELLSRIKNLGGKGRGSLFGGLLGGLKGLLPIIAAVGLALGKGAGLAGVSIYTGLKLKELYEVTREYFDVLKNVKDFQEKQHTVLSGIGEKYSGQTMFGKTPEEREAGRRGELQIRKGQEQKYYKEATSGVLGWITKRFVSAPSEIALEKQKNVPTLVKEKGEDWSREELLTVMKNTETQNQKLEDAIRGLSDSVKKDKEFSNIRGGGIGNQFDSADTLLGDRAAGNLTIDEE